MGVSNYPGGYLRMSTFPFTYTAFTSKTISAYMTLLSIPQHRMVGGYTVGLGARLSVRTMYACRLNKKLPANFDSYNGIVLII